MTQMRVHSQTLSASEEKKKSDLKETDSVPRKSTRKIQLSWTGVSQNEQKERYLSFIIALFALCFSIVNLGLTPSPEKQEAQDIQYVLYLGTNDKDSNEPVFSEDEAKARAEEILLRHFGGYTIQEANGGWIDGKQHIRNISL
ncbi:MAG: hypothetical protein K6C08_09345 [Oscillospiraceae bacterium]|nr:hypothetical protein [Oscillospiraceae bacterium]